MQKCGVTFLPEGKTIEVPKGTYLIEAARQAGIQLKSICGGNGSCGKCIGIVKKGSVSNKSVQVAHLTREQVAAGYVLCCQTAVQADMTVEIPLGSRLSEHRVLAAEEAREKGGWEKGGRTEEARESSSREETAREEEYLEAVSVDTPFRRVHLKLTQPGLEENTSDLTRVFTALQKETGAPNLQIGLPLLKALPEILRRNQWDVTVSLSSARGMSEIVEVFGGEHSEAYYGLAVDIGTTTIVVDMVDLRTGNSVSIRGGYNRQATYGDDVISRIVFADEHEDGIERLQSAVVKTINELIAEALDQSGASPDQVRVAICAGNTTMTHLFLGIPPKYIRLDPYVPAASMVPPVRAREIGLNIHPDAWVHCLPGVSSYVGGDITAGVLATGVSESDEITLFMDIGTNGEMVLGNKDWLLCCSCSAGPAFEGSGIKSGMRAMKGAIEQIEILPDLETVTYKTVGGEKPVGICGSGLIDCLATLQAAGIIDRSGRFREGVRSSRIRRTDEGHEFVLAWAREAGQGEDVVITENDVRNLIRAKAAVYAGVRVMLNKVDMSIDMIDRVLVAGGFGNYLNIKQAIKIGLLPDLPEARFNYVGNTSLKGARMCLVSSAARREVGGIAQKMTNLELSAGNDFMDEFTSALFLPHTDFDQFPSLKIASGQ